VPRTRWEDGKGRGIPFRFSEEEFSSRLGRLTPRGGSAGFPGTAESMQQQQQLSVCLSVRLLLLLQSSASSFS